MSNRGKKYSKVAATIDRTVRYPIEEAVAKLKETAFASFNETVEAAFRLGVDPRHADQVVRGTVVLPHGIGKNVRVLVIAQGEKYTEAQEAGADMVGTQDVIDKISGGWFDFGDSPPCGRPDPGITEAIEDAVLTDGDVDEVLHEHRRRPDALMSLPMLFEPVEHRRQGNDLVLRLVQLRREPC